MKRNPIEVKFIVDDEFYKEPTPKYIKELAKKAKTVEFVVDYSKELDFSMERDYLINKEMKELGRLN